MKYACIHSHLGKFRLRLMCRILGVSVSGFYAWRKRGPSERSKHDRLLLVEIERCHKASRRSYGSPRVFRSLKELGIRVGEKRVARLMRETGLIARTSRSMQETVGSSIVIDAIKMALSYRRPESGLLHHSDRGIQYAATDFRRLLRSRRIECSMSRKGDCWDNAVTESFFATLKKELVHDSAWKTREEARAALFEWIEVWYNGERRHSSIGYLSPTEYEKRLSKKAA